MTKKLNKKLLISILVFIFLILISAYIIEYNLGYEPCNLCIYERIPYFFSILLISKIFFNDSYERVTLLILSLTFIISSLLAFYHFGIEQGFFKESLACETRKITENLSKEELLSQLEQNVVSCKDVSLRILGFSLASINTIFSFFLSAIFFKLFINYGKN